MNARKSIIIPSSSSEWPNASQYVFVWEGSGQRFLRTLDMRLAALLGPPTKQNLQMSISIQCKLVISMDECVIASRLCRDKKKLAKDAWKMG